METPNRTPQQGAVLSLFNGHDPAIIENPFALLAQLWSEGAMHPVPFSVGGTESRTWMVTRMDEILVSRTIKPHRAFGHGSHMCPGATLAHLAGSIALTTLLTRAPDLRLAVPRERITWQFNLNSRSLAALPVAF